MPVLSIGEVGKMLSDLGTVEIMLETVLLLVTECARELALVTSVSV